MAGWTRSVQDNRIEVGERRGAEQTAGAPPSVAIFVAFSCTAIYFAGSAVAPALAADWRLSASEAAALSWAVQAGFIAGTLITAALNLPTASARIASSLRSSWLRPWRTGASRSPAATSGGRSRCAFAPAALGGPIYPIVMRLLATWFSRLGWQTRSADRAYTAGSGAGFLLRAAAVPWQQTLASTSAIALAAPCSPQRCSDRARCFRRAARSISWPRQGRFGVADYRRSAFAYFGHMWELFAFWMLMPFWLARAGLHHRPRPSLPGWCSSPERGLRRRRRLGRCASARLASRALRSPRAGRAASRRRSCFLRRPGCSRLSCCCGARRSSRTAECTHRSPPVRAEAVRRDRSHNPELDRFCDHDRLDRTGARCSPRGPSRGASRSCCSRPAPSSV